jgi:di/tricarboxylate transporter
MVTLGRRSLPTEPADPLADPGALREYLSEARITPRSPMIGLRIDEVDWAGREDLAVVQVLRRGRALPPWAPLEEGDELVLEGGPSAIADVLRSSAAEMTKEIELDATTLQSVDLVCVEVFLATESRYLGQTLRALDFRHSHGFTVLALSRGGRRLRRGPMRTRLRLGDSLLLVGSSEALPRLGADPDLVVVSGRPVPALGRRKALVVALLLAGVVLLALSDALGPVVTLPLAAVLAVLLGCIRPRDARDAIDWSTVITIAALLPFGTALEKTGAAKGLAHLLVGATAGAGPVVALAAVLLVGLALTQVIDNAAVAIVVAPIAYRVATELGVEPTPFFVGLGLCTSAAFCTPFAHESTLLVSNAGGYHFRHFLRAGWALAIVTWLVATALTPLVWPLRAG